MRTADPVQLVCRTASGSTYTVGRDGTVDGPRRGTLVGRAGGGRPSVGGRLLIETARGIVLTSELVQVEPPASAR